MTRLTAPSRGSFLTYPALATLTDRLFRDRGVEGLAARTEVSCNDCFGHARGYPFTGFGDLISCHLCPGTGGRALEAHPLTVQVRVADQGCGTGRASRNEVLAASASTTARPAEVTVTANAGVWPPWSASLPAIEAPSA